MMDMTRLQRRAVLTEHLGEEALIKTGAREFSGKKLRPDSHATNYVCADGMCVVAALIRDAGKEIDNLMPRAESAFSRITGHSVQHARPEDRKLFWAIRDLMSLNDEGMLATKEAVQYHLGLRDTPGGESANDE